MNWIVMNVLWRVKQAVRFFQCHRLVPGSYNRCVRFRWHRGDHGWTSGAFEWTIW